MTTTHLAVCIIQLLVHLSNRRHNCQPKHNVLMLYGPTLCQISRHRHLVTLHSTKTAPCYSTFHQDCTVLLYIPPRHLVILHSTMTVPCYFTSPRLYHVILHSTTTEPSYFTFHQDCILLFYIPTRMSTFSSSITKARFIIPKPVAPKSACLIAHVQHNVTTGVGN